MKEKLQNMSAITEAFHDLLDPVLLQPVLVPEKKQPTVVFTLRTNEIVESNRFVSEQLVECYNGPVVK